MQIKQNFEKAEIEIVNVFQDVICISIGLDDGIDTPLDEWD